MLDKKTVLVIGGSSGIGLGVASLVAREGGRLVLIGRDEEKLAAVTQNFATHRRDVRSFSLDATNVDALQAVLIQLGEVDHIACMVGGGLEGQFDTLHREVASLERRSVAALRIANAVLPHLNPGGSLTLTSGPRAKAPASSGIAIGNRAIELEVQALAVTSAPRIRVNAVAPSWMDTPRWDDIPEDQREAQRAIIAHRTPLGRTAALAEVAAAYLFAIENRFLTGQTLIIDGGLGLVT